MQLVYIVANSAKKVTFCVELFRGVAKLATFFGRIGRPQISPKKVANFATPLNNSAQKVAFLAELAAMLMRSIFCIRMPTGNRKRQRSCTRGNLGNYVGNIFPGQEVGPERPFSLQNHTHTDEDPSISEVSGLSAQVGGYFVLKSNDHSKWHAISFDQDAQRV